MTAIGEAGTKRSIAVKWVKNNIVSAIVSGLASLGVYGVRHATGALEPGAGVGEIAFLFVVMIVLSSFSGAAYGVLTGAVLQRVVPLLPVRAWVALNVAMAIVAGVLTELGLMFLSEPQRGADDGSLAETLLIGIVFGGVCGIGMGALQALVLRRAALGSATWMLWSGPAFVVVTLMVVLTSRALDTGSGLAGELVSDVVGVFGFALGSIVMLPALWALRNPLLSRAGQYFH